MGAGNKKADTLVLQMTSKRCMVVFGTNFFVAPTNLDYVITECNKSLHKLFSLQASFMVFTLLPSVQLKQKYTELRLRRKVPSIV